MKNDQPGRSLDSDLATVSDAEVSKRIAYLDSETSYREFISIFVRPTCLSRTHSAPLPYRFPAPKSALELVFVLCFLGGIAMILLVIAIE